MGQGSNMSETTKSYEVTEPTLMAGNLLKTIRLVKGMSATKLANQVGFSVATVSKLENNLVEVTIGSLKKYSELTGLPLSAILFAIEQTNSEKPVDISSDGRVCFDEINSIFIKNIVGMAAQSNLNNEE